VIINSSNNATRKKISQRGLVRKTVRFTMSQAISIEENAKIANLSVAEFIRAASLNIKIKPAIPILDHETLRLLANVSNNLNQIAKKANQTNQIELAELQEARNIINEFILTVIKNSSKRR